jgi:hypothetical protein
METLTPSSVMAPEVPETATDKVPVLFFPIAQEVLGTAVGLAIDFGQEVLRPELSQQQHPRQPARNQQELLHDLAEIVYLQTEADVLEAQSPGRFMRGLFGSAEEIREDIEKMTAVRSELAEIASTPPQAPAVEVQYTPQTVSTVDAGNL